MLYRAVSLFVTISPLSFYRKYKDERKALDKFKCTHIHYSKHMFKYQ